MPLRGKAMLMNILPPTLEKHTALYSLLTSVTDLGAIELINASIGYGLGFKDP